MFINLSCTPCAPDLSLFSSDLFPVNIDFQNHFLVQPHPIGILAQCCTCLVALQICRQRILLDFFITIFSLDHSKLCYFLHARYPSALFSVHHRISIFSFLFTIRLVDPVPISFFFIFIIFKKIIQLSHLCFGKLFQPSLVMEFIGQKIKISQTFETWIIYLQLSYLSLTSFYLYPLIQCLIFLLQRSCFSLGNSKSNLCQYPQLAYFIEIHRASHPYPSPKLFLSSSVAFFLSFPPFLPYYTPFIFLLPLHYPNQKIGFEVFSSHGHHSQMKMKSQATQLHLNPGPTYLLDHYCFLLAFSYLHSHQCTC